MNLCLFSLAYAAAIASMVYPYSAGTRQSIRLSHTVALV